MGLSKAKKEAQKRYLLKNKDRWRKYHSNRRRVRKYGISTSEYDEMVEAQGGVCLLCGRPPGTRCLVIDHDHQTGDIRGLLCNSCNVGIGMFSDNPELLMKAALYLKGKYERQD